MSDSETTTEHTLRLRRHDDDTWSVDVEGTDGNVRHSETGLASKEEAQHAGSIWITRQVSARTIREALGKDVEA